MNDEEKLGLAQPIIDELDPDDIDSYVELDENMFEETMQDIVEYEEETGKHLSVPGEDYDPEEEFQKETDYTENLDYDEPLPENCEDDLEYFTSVPDPIDEWANEKSKELDILLGIEEESDNNGK